MSKSLLGVALLLLVGCGGNEAGALFGDALPEVGGMAQGGAVASAGETAEAGRAVTAAGSATTAGATSEGGSGSAAGAAQTGGGGSVGGAGVAGAEAAGSPAAGSGGQETGGAGGGTGGGVAGASEQLLFEANAPETQMQGQYNHELNSTSTVAIIAAGYKATDLVNANQACSLSGFLQFANHVTGTRAGTFPGTCAVVFGSDVTTFQIDFYLGASVGLFASTSKDSEQLDLSAYHLTRWEVEVTKNDWTTISTAPNIYSWDGAATLRVYAAK